MQRSMISVVGVVAVMLALGVYPAMAATYVETFSSDNAGWEYVYGGGYTVVTAPWVNSGGNLGGYISDSVEGLYGVQLYNTVQPFGDMNGLTMTIDTLVTGDVSGNAQFYVGRGGTYFIDGPWSITGDTTWTTHQAALNSTNFTLWGGHYTLQEVLAAPDDVGIFFGGGQAYGTGTLGVDNFGINPEPATMALLAVGGIGMILCRRRNK